MTPERWKQIEALYHAARALPAADRSAYLASSCPDDPSLQLEVERLLSQPHSNEGWLAGHARDVASGLVTQHPALVNKTLGGYDLQALIGVGGMSEVYRARDLKLGGTSRSRCCPRNSPAIAIGSPASNAKRECSLR